MIKAIVETTILVDLLRNHPPAIEWYQSQTEPTLAITPIIWMEIIGGGQNKTEQMHAARLLKQFDMVYLTPSDQAWAMQSHIQAQSWSGYDGLFNCLSELPLASPLVHS